MLRSGSPKRNLVGEDFLTQSNSSAPNWTYEIHTYVLSNNLVVPMILRIFICIFSIKVHQLAEGAPTPLDPGGEWPGHIPGQVRQSPGQVEPKQGGLPTFWPLATTTTTTRGGLGMSSHCLTTRFMPESIATESQRWSFYKSIRSLMMLKRRRTHVCTQGSNWWISKQMFFFYVSWVHATCPKGRECWQSTGEDARCI